MIDPNQDEIIPLSDDQTETSLDTPPKEGKYVVEQAQATYCEFETIQERCQWPKIYLNHLGLLSPISIIDEAT